MGQYTSYYLYQKYEQRDGQDPIPCFPSIYSIDADGTMQKVIKLENDPDCGYTPPPVEPIYRWYQVPITQDYICESCGTPPTPTGNTKFYAVYDTGETYTLQCNESSILTSAETRDFTTSITAMTSCVVGSCVTEIANQAIGVGYGWNSSLTSVTIQEGVEIIGERAFYGSSGITSITLPNSVTTIKKNAFQVCNNLQSLTIGSGITSFSGGTVISGLGKLTSLTVMASTPPTVWQSEFYSVNTGLTVYVPCESVTAYYKDPRWGTLNIQGIPTCDTVYRLRATKVGSSEIFYKECTSPINYENTLTSADTEIQTAHDFVGGSSMETVEIGCTTIIGEKAFSGYTNLVSVTFHEGLKKIRSKAFRHCDSLSSITIPSTVTEIGSEAFLYCDNVQSLTLLCTTVPEVNYGSFPDGNIYPIYVPAESVDLYKSRWSGWADRIYPIS